MRPLLIGPAELAELARVKAHAEAHFFTLEALQAAMASGVSHCQDWGFRCVLPVGFRVAFTIERHPSGWARHLSVSLADAPKGTLPGEAAVEIIGRELGMRMDMRPSTFLYLEGDPPFAVSVIEPIEGDTPSDREWRILERGPASSPR